MPRTQHQSPQGPWGRYPAIDALRGAALIAMFGYHFAFDLVYFRIIQANPYESGLWIGSRTLILGSFLLLVGVSLVLANRDGIRWPAFGRRLAKIAGSALLVSAGSYYMFPRSWIYFGVLHHIALASLLGIVLLRFDRFNLLFGLALVAVGILSFGHAPALFDERSLNWIGWINRKPVTEDYVPLLPWFGVVLIGMFLGKRLVAAPATLKAWQPSWAASRLLALAGRHTLLLYLVHQPIFIGVLTLMFGEAR